VVVRGAGSSRAAAAPSTRAGDAPPPALWDRYCPAMDRYRSAALGLYAIAVVARLLTWGELSASERSESAVTLLLAGAAISAVLSLGSTRTDRNDG
jgi:hypothetical protein